jgi:hypothetical protein
MVQGFVLTRITEMGAAPAGCDTSHGGRGHAQGGTAIVLRLLHWQQRM